MRLLRLLIVLLAVGGIVDSTLALRIHYQDPSQAPPCKVTEKWDCGAVNHSRFAVFPPTSFDENPAAHTHVPVAVFGIVGYALIGVLALTGKLWWLLQAAEIGFGFAAMLSYMEAYVLEKWCIYCVWSQMIIAAILLCTIVALVLQRKAGSRE
jgi:vitamin-K-epoxide reductase (warfarin-sensitive)